MPKPTKGPRLGGGPAHERLMLANLATALFTHGRIKTTETKAKRLRPLAERLVTFAKRGDLHARRRVMTVIRDKSAVHTLFMEIAPQVMEREGGYTRIIKTGFRKGDNAPMAVIELVLEPVNPKPKTKKAAPVEEKAAAPVVAPDQDVTEVVETLEGSEVVTESVEVAIDETGDEPQNDDVADFVAEGAPALPAEEVALDQAEESEPVVEEVAEEETK